MPNKYRIFIVIVRSFHSLSSSTMYEHTRKQSKAVIVIENNDKETLNMYSPLTSIMKNAKNNERKPDPHKLCLTQQRFCWLLCLLDKYFFVGSPINLWIAFFISSMDSSYTPFLQTIYCKGNRTIMTDFSYSESSIRTGSIFFLNFCAKKISPLVHSDLFEFSEEKKTNNFDDSILFLCDICKKQNDTRKWVYADIQYNVDCHAKA